MIRKIDVGLSPSREPLGNPTPLGLLGLALGCAALTPAGFGYALTPGGLTTAAVWALLFGAGCQLLCGVLSFVNRNTFGATIFTAFSFLWMVNAWSLRSMAQGVMPDHAVGLATELALFVIFAVLTYGFGYFTSVLFAFLVDIDLLFACRIARSLTSSPLLDPVIGVLTVAMGLLALWLAFAALINPVAGKEIFKLGSPLFRPPKKKSFDWRIRYNLFEILYHHWRQRAFAKMPFAELRAAMTEAVGPDDIVPDLFYLCDFGCLVLEHAPADEGTIVAVRLNAAGIDLYEQIALKKYEAG
jgi:succinate-acetate transporter protein